MKTLKLSSSHKITSNFFIVPASGKNLISYSLDPSSIPDWSIFYKITLDFQEKNLNLDREIFLLKIQFVNSTRHEIYRLNLNYKVRFHLIIIDLKITF